MLPVPLIQNYLTTISISFHIGLLSRFQTITAKHIVETILNKRFINLNIIRIKMQQFL